MLELVRPGARLIIQPAVEDEFPRRNQIRELTDRKRALLPVEDVVRDVNHYLRGW
jgi:hypothetical protein